MKTAFALLTLMAITGCASQAPREPVPAVVEIRDVRLLQTERGLEVRVAASVTTPTATRTRHWGARLDAVRVSLEPRDGWPGSDLPVCVTERLLEELAIGAPVKHLLGDSIDATEESPLTEEDAREAVFVQVVRQPGATPPVLVRIARADHPGRVVDPTSVVTAIPPYEPPGAPLPDDASAAAVIGRCMTTLLDGALAIGLGVLLVATFPLWLPIYASAF